MDDKWMIVLIALGFIGLMIWLNSDVIWPKKNQVPHVAGRAIEDALEEHRRHFMEK